MRRTAVAGGASLLAVAAGAALLVVLVLGNADNEPTRAEYIASVNGVCREYNARLDKIPPPIALGNPDAIAESIGRALPLVMERAEKARAIEPPKELAHDVERLFSLSDEAIRKLRAARRAAEAGNLRRSGTALGQFLAISQQARQAAAAIGLSC